MSQADKLVKLASCQGELIRNLACEFEPMAVDHAIAETLSALQDVVEDLDVRNVNSIANDVMRHRDWLKDKPFNRLVINDGCPF